MRFIRKNKPTATTLAIATSDVIAEAGDKKGTKKNRPVSPSHKRTLIFALSKRQKFVLSVCLLSIGLFFTEFQFGKSGIVIALIISAFTDLFLYWALRPDLKENFTWHLFILPFFYSLAFGLFYFLVPARLLFRGILTLLYAFGLYSLFLSQNIFTVTVVSTRTIALLSGARIVSFVITLISFFFLANTLFSLHLFVVPSVLLFFVFTSLLIAHSLWTYSLQKSPYPLLPWVIGLSICLFECAIILWFWPSTPTLVALFLTGFFYTIVGMSHVWLERKLFRGVLWEYLWVAVIVFFVLIVFSTWGR